VLRPVAWLAVRGWIVGDCSGRGCGGGLERGDRIGGYGESEAVARFLGEDPGNRADRNRDFLRGSIEARGEPDPLVVDRQPPRRAATDVEDDLAVLDVRDRNPRLRVDLHREIRRQTVVGAPFADRADQVGLGGLLGHGASIQIGRPAVNPVGTGSIRRARATASGGSRGYLRIPRSADVNASMNAGRENRRSAYFISGAAGFGNWMP